LKIIISKVKSLKIFRQIIKSLRATHKYILYIFAILKLKWLFWVFNYKKDEIQWKLGFFKAKKLFKIENHYHNKLLKERDVKKRESLYQQAYHEIYSFYLKYAPEITNYGFSEDLLLPYIDYFSKKVVLDYGCGYGNSSSILSRYASHVYAVDASRIALEAAKVKYKSTKNIEFIHHASPYVWLEDESIDAVYSIDVVEHLHPEDFKIHLNEIYRILTKGGIYLFITCDGDYGPSDCSSWFYPKGFGIKPRGIHLKEYTFVELIQLVAASGYKIAEIPKLDFPFGIVIRK
jgi:ubiquinone/menaquinone biosynthesis C-methylase UbiE